MVHLRSSTLSLGVAPFRCKPGASGLRALSGDLNPVAVLIQKATLEIPTRSSRRPPYIPTTIAIA